MSFFFFAGEGTEPPPIVSIWPAYLRQEHAQARFVLALEQRRDVTRLHRLQRNRQRSPMAWMPRQNEFGAPPVMKVPWRIWTIRR